MYNPNTHGDRTGAGNEPPSRVFVDAEGIRWEVFERPHDAFDRRSGMSLIFVSEGAVRRVRQYPDNWMDLSPDELIALSWKC